MSAATRHVTVRLGISLLLLLVGASLTVGGIWLALLGGSYYYLAAGVVTLVVASLVWQGRILGLWLYLALAALTLAWAVWEVGLNGWLLLPRVGLPLGLAVLVLLALWPAREAPERRRVVQALLCIIAVVAGLFLTTSVREADWLLAPSLSVPDLVATTGEDASQWRHYGRSGAGTRFVPAVQINRDNVHQLEPAWTYRSGDLPPGLPGSAQRLQFSGHASQSGRQSLLLFTSQYRDCPGGGDRAGALAP